MKRTITLIIGLLLSSTLTFAAEKGDPSNLGPLAVCADKLLDINNATIDQLHILPGLDYAYSRKIITGRPYQIGPTRIKKHHSC